MKNYNLTVKKEEKKSSEVHSDFDTANDLLHLSLTLFDIQFY